MEKMTTTKELLRQARSKCLKLRKEKKRALDAYNDVMGSLCHALDLIYQIRRAVGDSEARLMQHELVEKCRELYQKSNPETK